MTLDYERYLLPVESMEAASCEAQLIDNENEIDRCAPMCVNMDSMCFGVPLDFRHRTRGVSNPTAFDTNRDRSVFSTSYLCSTFYNHSLREWSDFKCKDNPMKTPFPSTRVDTGRSSPRPTSFKSKKPSKHKSRNSVKFADDCGENLVTFVLLPPSDVCDNDNDNSGMYSADCVGSERTAACSRGNNNVPLCLTSDRESGEAESDVNNNCSCPKNNNGCRLSTIVKCRLHFNQPVACFDEFHRYLEKNNVALENAKVVDSTLLMVTCSIKVKNLNPSKRVFARCTYDNWSSYVDVEAGYVSAGYESALYDTFSFSLTKPALPPDAVSASVEFAICYSVDDQEFWDSNHNNNYIIDWFSDHSCHDIGP